VKMQAKLGQAPSEHRSNERKVSSAGDAEGPKGPGQEIDRGKAAGARTYRIRASDWRKCPQSNAGPGSVLRPGAMSTCPTTSTIGYRSRRTTSSSATREY